MVEPKKGPPNLSFQRASRTAFVFTLATAQVLCVDELLSRQIMGTTEGSAVRQAYGFAAKQRLMEITTSAVNS